MRDVRADVVHRVVRELDRRFTTHDVVRHPYFQDGHDDAAALAALTGKHLRQNATSLNIEYLGQGGSPRAAQWRKMLADAPDSAERDTTRPAVRPSHPVRSGHWNAVRLMTTEQFAAVTDVLTASDVAGGVFFRVTEKGVCAVDLHPESPKPLVGVGPDPYITGKTTAAQVQKDLAQREAHLQEVRERQAAPSRENQFEAGLIRYALAHELRLPEPFPSSLRLFAHQWRLVTDRGNERLDLLCVDLVTGSAAVVELKPVPDAAGRPQAGRYAGTLRAEAARLGMFMTAYARATASVFDVPQMVEVDVDLAATRALVAWPDALGVLQVAEVDLDEPVKEAEPPGGAHRLGIGPQYPKDPPFTARMRQHQSWWRSEVLRAPYGTGPGPGSTSFYGNMLDAEGGEQLLNFLTDDIRQVYLAREGPGVEPFRARRNLLSSQPMCFNLFGQFAANRGLATRFLRLLLPSEVEQVTDVRVEWAPQPAREYLGDRTSFDAAIEYSSPSGSIGFLGIETKLTEPFTQKHYDSPSYWELTRRADSPWREESWDQLSDLRWTQLWRNHLLVEAYRRHPATPISGLARLVLVRHPGDRECAEVVAAYRSFLRDDSFIDLPLDRLDELISPVLETSAEQSWWSAFRQRYVDLNGSA